MWYNKFRIPCFCREFKSRSWVKWIDFFFFFFALNVWPFFLFWWLKVWFVYPHMFSILDVFLKIEHFAQAKNIVHCWRYFGRFNRRHIVYLHLFLFKCNGPDGWLKLFSTMVVLRLIDNHRSDSCIVWSFRSSSFIRDKQPDMMRISVIILLRINGFKL